MTCWTCKENLSLDSKSKLRNSIMRSVL